VATLPVNNPQRILQALDSYLERQTRVVLFGRAALALGFGEKGAQFGATKDVDAILPNVEMAKIESDDQFWKAIESTNKILEPSGLYLTHLFTDRQVALTPDWLEKVVPIPSESYRFLRLFRPSSIDLILTKMMRNDAQDLEDIRFIMEQESIPSATLSAAFQRVLPLGVIELQEIFVKMQPIVLDLALEIESGAKARNKVGPSSISLDPDWWAKLTNPPTGSKGIEKDREIEL
jgi:hypothetical protein